MADLTASPLAAYTLLPSVRRGLASRISGSSGKNYASLDLSLAVNGAPVPAPAVRFLGPGDVKSIDPRGVIRTDPRDGVDDFESNYLASVEFNQPDFPWMFTPVGPDANGRLKPWICLVVVPDAPGATLNVRQDGTAMLVLDSPLDPQVELPDLKDIDVWAHAQVMGENLTDVHAALDGVSGAHLSRLISPRKLEPAKRYLACVVPTYLAGVNAGLGLTVKDDDLTPAWGPDTHVPFTLPVYYSFRFQTGIGGDFESLASKILPIGPGDPKPRGSRTIDVSEPNFGMSPVPGLTLQLEGALVPLKYKAEQWADSSRIPFAASLRATLAPPPAKDPPVTPPVYGRKETGQELPADGAPPVWMGELNLDPRRRAAASAGAQIVKRDQDALVASAWEQLGEIRRANQLLRQAQLARQLSLSIAARHLDTIADDGAFLQITAPVHSRVRIQPSAGPPATMSAQIAAGVLPPGSMSAALRKLARPRGPLGRNLPRPQGPRSIVTTLASGNLLSLSQAFTPPGVLTASNAGFPSVSGAAGAASPFATAIRTLGSQMMARRGPAPAPPPAVGPAVLADRRAQLRPKLDPVRTIPTRVGARLPLTTLGDPLRPQTMTPVFDEPMYSALADLGVEWMLAGIADLQSNRATLLRTNAPFVEAFMVGLSDEMSRELLWRQVPVDLKATYFHNFWGTIENGAVQPDILEIASFNPAGKLGAHTPDPPGGKVVLLIRADLFRRYPNALVSAVPAQWDATKKQRVLAATGRVYPSFRGQIGNDIYFFGFDKPDQASALGAADPAKDPGWYFLLEEHPTEPRFGLEPEPHSSSARPGWSDFAWTQVTPVHNHLSVTESPPATPAGEPPDWVHYLPVPKIAWGAGAAEMAYILMREPVRIAMHAQALIPPE